MELHVRRDWGSAVTDAIGRKAPAGCVGLHFNLPLVFPTPDEVADATEHEATMIADAQHYQDVLSGYAKEMATRPQTVGYSLSDSPAGLAAFIYQLFADVSDSDGDPETVFGRDAMLDDIMLCWLPNTGATSARLYWEAAQEGASAPFPSGPNPTPAGFSIFPKEAVRASRRWIERRYETSFTSTSSPPAATSPPSSNPSPSPTKSEPPSEQPAEASLRVGCRAPAGPPAES